MRNYIVGGALALLALAAYSTHERVRNVESEIFRAREQFEAISDSTSVARERIAARRDEALREIALFVTSDMGRESRAIVDIEIARLRDEVGRLRAETARESSKLDSLQASYRQLSQGLPPLVELDDLQAKYSKLVAGGVFRQVETFKTAKGNISFNGNNLESAEIPSTRELAWVRIGKSESTENSELILAWLEESAEAKIRLGYAREYKRTKPTDYGECTEALYRKGDMYCKTFYQYSRIQGTYDRHSLQYKYYVEIGSDSRRRAFALEQYNAKLGS